MFSNKFKLLFNKINNNNYNKREFISFIVELQNCLSNYIIPNKINLPYYYPEENGFCKSFDVINEAEQLLNYWHNYRFVVAKDIIDNTTNIKAIKKINDLIQSVVLDENGASILSRGFLDIYHDDSLLQIRQSPKLFVYHCLLLNHNKIWTTFDRFGVKTFYDDNKIGLSLHVDQNPNVHPEFTTIQGVLALNDCPKERGTFLVSLDSIKDFHKYKKFINSGYVGEFVSLDDDLLYKEMIDKSQAITLRKNSIVSWDSRLTHANTSNKSNENRYVCYVSAGIAKEEYKDIIDIRKKYFDCGLGVNNRDAYMHASKKPRFNDQKFLNDNREKEQFSILGKCLYGFERYEL